MIYYLIQMYRFVLFADYSHALKMPLRAYVPYWLYKLLNQLIFIYEYREYGANKFCFHIGCLINFERGTLFVSFDMYYIRI
jgi:hypothetical protein